MALIELSAPDLSPVECQPPASGPEHLVQNPEDVFAALDRLRLLHDEAGRNLLEAQLLARIPAACAMLMLTGAMALIWAGLRGDAGLRPGFAWAALLLIGIIAMIGLHIRGIARSLRHAPLAEAVSELRLLLLYMGIVWGSGVFLIMPGLPAPAQAVLFALLPSLGLALILRDAGSYAAFAAPAAFLTAGASLTAAWPQDRWVAGAILTGIAGPGLGFLRQARRPRQAPLGAPAQS
jgi:hypothetical protein